MVLEQLIVDSNVLCIYKYGSIVYKTNKKTSDEDYVVVTSETPATFYHKSNNMDINFYSKKEWDKMCTLNDIVFCECYFLPKEFIIKETFRPCLNINFNSIRSIFSQKASNSFVKCKKKLTIEEDFSPYIGKKSLWHSLRIIMFGIQLLEKQYIYDYSCANQYYKNIVDININDWLFFKENYQPLYNSLKSEFRKMAIKQS